MVLLLEMPSLVTRLACRKRNLETTMLEMSLDVVAATPSLDLEIDGFFC
jgi:hypothetical protein